MKVTEKNGVSLVKNHRNIIVGFVEMRSDGKHYFAFGRPSQASYIAFDCESREKGIEKIKEYWGN